MKDDLGLVRVRLRLDWKAGQGLRSEVEAIASSPGLSSISRHGQRTARQPVSLAVQAGRPHHNCTTARNRVGTGVVGERGQGLTAAEPGLRTIHRRIAAPG
jgi:hypothetical protein